MQLQLLTATVKLFLKRPSEAQEMVQAVLGLATQDSDNPDLREGEPCQAASTMPPPNCRAWPHAQRRRSVLLRRS